MSFVALLRYTSCSAYTFITSFVYVAFSFSSYFYQIVDKACALPFVTYTTYCVNLLAKIATLEAANIANVANATVAAIVKATVTKDKDKVKNKDKDKVKKNKRNKV
jgi:hypothetical protein